MATQLHSRKKQPSSIDPESIREEKSPPSIGKRKRKSKKNIGVGLELGYAVLAIGLFLLVGLSLSFFLLHHQHRKVIFHVMRDPWAHGGAVLSGRAGFRHHFYTGPARFVTVVMPSVVAPEGRRRRLKSIQDTWGQYARAIYVVHNVDSEFPEAAHAVIGHGKTPEDPYSFPQLLHIPKDISDVDGIPRLFYAIKTVLEKVDPDFAFFVNDHTFVIPEHLCKYLEYVSPDEDMYHGHAILENQDALNSGAAGYLLSRATMTKVVQKYDTKDSHCYAENPQPFQQENPGLLLLQCLKSLGIEAVDTRAAHKWHRFHAFPLTREVSGQVDGWYQEKHQGMSAAVPSFDSSYETLLHGEDCCSKSTISFHYVEYMESVALFAIREALLTHPHISDHELKTLIHAEWPKEMHEIGAYSRGVPAHSDAEGWRHLLATLRKISTRSTQRDC